MRGFVPGDPLALARVQELGHSAGGGEQEAGGGRAEGEVPDDYGHRRQGKESVANGLPCNGSQRAQDKGDHNWKHVRVFRPRQSSTPYAYDNLPSGDRQSIKRMIGDLFVVRVRLHFDDGAIFHLENIVPQFASKLAFSVEFDFDVIDINDLALFQ